MRALAQKGERGEALAQYEACRRVLAQELGAEPSEETEALCESIRRASPGQRSRNQHSRRRSPSLK